MSNLTIALNELAKLLREEYGQFAADLVAEARDTIEGHEAALHQCRGGFATLSETKWVEYIDATLAKAFEGPSRISGTQQSVRNRDGE